MQYFTPRGLYTGCTKYFHWLLLPLRLHFENPKIILCFTRSTTIDLASYEIVLFYSITACLYSSHQDIMNRENSTRLPYMQVEYIDDICYPLYKVCYFCGCCVCMNVCTKNTILSLLLPCCLVLLL